MNVVDSSAWLEYFADGPNASVFARPIQDVDNLVVPSITLYEVWKRVARERGPADATQAVANMKRGTVVELDAALAVAAARLGLEAKLPLADSVVLATARARGATLWTQDADFEGMAGVEYRRRG